MISLPVTRTTLGQMTMHGRPPRRSLTPDQERAASAFIDGAETPAIGEPDGPAVPVSQADDVVSPSEVERGESVQVKAKRTPRATREGSRRSPSLYPWEAEYVREDVKKGYALRLPEPLYLRLKYAAEGAGQSINQLCQDAIAEEVYGWLETLGVEASRR